MRVKRRRRPTAIKLEPVVNKGCFNYLEQTIDRYSLAQIVKTNPFDHPKWRALLTENDPASFTSAVAAPLLIYQGGSDEADPAGLDPTAGPAPLHDRPGRRALDLSRADPLQRHPPGRARLRALDGRPLRRRPQS